MRAKRSKRYRKTMAQYTLAPFSFREPYQVLLDAAFLRACHAFHMPLQKFLENTLQGKCRLFVTRCSLAKIMGEWEREKKAGAKGGAGGGGRPEFLPPPTEVPLRYCKHSDEETVVGEVECLVDLLAGQPRGNEQPKNKQHFVLATADPTDAERRRAGRGFVDVREAARNVPGVPIVYVKRSVMVLEELSLASKRVKGGVERERLREGLIGGVGGRKRKRAGEDGEEVVGDVEGGEGGDPEGFKRRGVVKRAKGPNPLSVRKKKVKGQPQLQQQDRVGDTDAAAGAGQAVSNDLQEGTEMPKAKRRRKHKGKSGDERGGSEVGTLDGVAAASQALQAVVA